jgi:hypothetical protein
MPEEQASARPKAVPLGIIEQRHESEVHVQLLMTVEQGSAGIVGDKVDLHFLISAKHDDILDNPGRRLSGDAREFEAMTMQMHGVNVVAGIAHAQPIALPWRR